MKYPLLVMKYGDFIREQIIENNAVGASLVGAPKNNREQRAGTRPAPTDANIRSLTLTPLCGLEPWLHSL